MKRQKNVDGNSKTKPAAPPKAEQGKKITKVKKKATAVEIEGPPEDNTKEAIVGGGISSSGGGASSYSNKLVKEANMNVVGVGGSCANYVTNYGGSGGGGGSNVEGLEEYWAWLRGGVVDEQMSWGSTWMPFWDVEYMGEACGEMFSDVVWDDDIWNLRHLDNFPNP